MCGIAGFISKNQTYDKKAIVSGMLQLLSHRGPDQTGLGVFDDIALGMVRLSIIDIEKHTIPYENFEKTHAIVYNGEVYNHNHIRVSLKSKYTFQTNSDAESVLAGFICNGDSAFNEFNGMYAFAIYNQVDKITTIVRDKVGEKPLYYTQGKDFFAFASEIKALLTLVPPVFNEDAVSYRAYEFVVGRETLFKNIYSLEPGEYLTVKEDTFTIHNYWKIWENLVEIEDDQKKIINQLSELLEDAILLRTKNCAHQYGCFVSGGVDSALVACIAKPDYIFTAHYDYDDFDELDFAQMVAKKINKELIVVTPDKEDFLRSRKDIAWHLDTPCTWTSFTLWELVKRAAQENVKVIMSGDGADEMFGGYHRYHLLHHDEQIHQLEALKKYSYMISKYYGSPVERYAKLVNRCDNIYNDEVNNYLVETIGYYFERTNKDILHLMGISDFYTTMQVLLQMADRVTMAHHIENRSPFLDYRLVQFAFSVPSKYKINNGITKWLLKEVAKNFVPKEIPERTDKRGFSAPVNKWFKWEKFGKYNRSDYRDMVFDDWKKGYKIRQ